MNSVLAKCIQSSICFLRAVAQQSSWRWRSAPTKIPPQIGVRPKSVSGLPSGHSENRNLTSSGSTNRLLHSIGVFHAIARIAMSCLAGLSGNAQ